MPGSHALLPDSEKHTCKGMDAALKGQVPISDGIGGQAMGHILPFSISSQLLLSLTVEGGMVLSAGSPYVVASATLSVTPLAVTYVYLDLSTATPAIASGASVPADCIQLYQVTANATQITAVSDVRAFLAQDKFGPEVRSLAISDVDTTLAALDVSAKVLVLTGALTAARTITVPVNTGPLYVVNSTTGGFGLTLKTAAGAVSNTLANGKTASFYADATEARRLTADV